MLIKPFDIKDNPKWLWLNFLQQIFLFFLNVNLKNVKYGSAEWFRAKL